MGFFFSLALFKKEQKVVEFRQSHNRDSIVPQSSWVKKKKKGETLLPVFEPWTQEKYEPYMIDVLILCILS